MKKINVYMAVITVIMATLAFGCSKKSDPQPTPDPGPSISGSYSITHVIAYNDEEGKDPYDVKLNGCATSAVFNLKSDGTGTVTQGSDCSVFSPQVSWQLVGTMLTLNAGAKNIMKGSVKITATNFVISSVDDAGHPYKVITFTKKP